MLPKSVLPDNQVVRGVERKANKVGLRRPRLQTRSSIAVSATPSSATTVTSSDSTVAMSLPEVKFTKLFIDNKFVDSVSGATYTTVNPATEEPICKVIEWFLNIGEMAA